MSIDKNPHMSITVSNSISMSKGGTHVQLVADQIYKSLITRLEKKNKAVKIKIPQIKNHIWVFANALIENSTFDSQTKEQLTLLAGKFGSKPALTEASSRAVSLNFDSFPIRTSTKSNGKVASQVLRNLF